MMDRGSHMEKYRDLISEYQNMINRAQRNYQPKNALLYEKSLKNYHTFALFDQFDSPKKVGNSMSLVA